MLAFTTGLSSLTTSQQVLDLIGQNIANANTPGYNRQEALLAAQYFGGPIGSGVAVSYLLRDRSSLVESAYTQNQFESASVNTQVDSLNQVQSLVASGPNSIDTLLGQFFNQVDQLTAQPDDPAQRQVVVSSLSTLAGQFNSLSSNLEQLRAGINSQVQQAVQQVNALTPQIASLNSQINQAEALGQQPNDLLDRRDQLINQLAQYVDVRTVPQPNGVVNVLGAGSALVVGFLAGGLQYGTGPGGNIVITAPNSATPLTVSGGQLGGLLQLYNQTLPSYQGQLDTLAHTLAQKIDGVQATGLGTDGPFTALNGTRAVSDVTVPLASANPEFPVQAGDLFVSLTNQATGQRTLTQVALDPATQSLQQIATAITTATGGQLQATVNTTSRTLQFQAQAGYTFDFAGRPPTSPAFTGFAGTTTPQLGGAYTGAANDAYTFQIAGGGGTVGVTPNLTLQVFDSANNLVASLNVGQGYTPGTALNVANGVTVQLSAGTFTSGSFTYPVVSQPDTTGLLTALGVNTAFTGSTASDLAVNSALAADPGLLSSSRTGQPGDSSNLQQLSALRDQATLAGGTQTFEQYYAGLVGTVGGQAQQLQQQQSAQQALATQLTAQRQAISGVDPNQEMVNMLLYQRQYQYAAHYISTVNTTLDALLNIQ